MKNNIKVILFLLTAMIVITSCGNGTPSTGDNSSADTTDTTMENSMACSEACCADAESFAPMLRATTTVIPQAREVNMVSTMSEKMLI